VRSKRYDSDILAPGSNRRRSPVPVPEIVAEPGLVVEDSEGRFCGAVVRTDKDSVTLEDRHGKRRVFPYTPRGFLLDGRPVTLLRPVKTGMSDMSGAGRAGGTGAGGTGGARGTGGAGTARKTASGSIAAPGPFKAKVARASRIYVEGKHDAELVERIWGDDLRDVGVVVEYLEGIDDLAAIVAEFDPSPARRLGVLVDHLVDGSKESKIAAAVRGNPGVLVVGHPFIDIWEAVRPSAVGIAAWPRVPRGQEWKAGVLSALGWPPDTAAAWKRILGSVRGYADLTPELLGRVEELIDFVTAPGGE
jgi:hypothetical protein